jgi:peptide/nickel transport system substrate-binding protein
MLSNTSLRQVSGRLFSLLVVVSFGMSVFLSACQPPDPKAGLQIEKITQQKAKGDFETRVINGVEMKISRDPVGRFGGTFYTASPGRGPKTFSPLASKDGTSSSIGGLMFIGLLETDAYTGLPVPHLAKSYRILPDNQTYLVTLRKGLVWSDGYPLTADDVVYTWNDIVLKGLGNPSARDILLVDGKLPTVEKVDELTIRFKTPVPFAPFIESLGQSIYPKHIIDPVIRDNPKKFDSFWGVSADPSSFVVNGPFILEKYDSGQRVTLKRNPKYFMANRNGERLPYLDRYVIDFVQDENAQFLLFQQGRLDELGIPGSQVSEIRRLNFPKFRIIDLGPATGSQFLTFNLNPRINKTTHKPYVRPEASRWFRDPNLRHAVDYAIDREAMVMNILRGVGKPLFTAESLNSIYLNKDLAKGHPRDLAHAKALLKRSGFRWNKAGELLDKTGKRVEFELNTNAGNLGREATGVQIKNDLAELGMKVNFRAVDFNVLVGRMDTGGWECMIMGLTGSGTEPHGGANVWSSQGALHFFNQRLPATDSSENSYLEPWETELDHLFNQGAKTIGYTNRLPYYHAYQKVIYDNALMLYLYSPSSIQAVRTRVQNFFPTTFSAFHNIESIWISSTSESK